MRRVRVQIERQVILTVRLDEDAYRMANGDVVGAAEASPPPFDAEGEPTGPGPSTTFIGRAGRVFTWADALAWGLVQPSEDDAGANNG